MKERADKILTERGLVSSRSQAKSLIEKGDVTVNGKNISKAGEMIELESEITIASPKYVGRGAFKLIKALEDFNIDVDKAVCADFGASTGGFTEVLLEKGASKIYAIDVGHDQLAVKLRNHSQVINMEGTNLKDLKSLPELLDGAVMDLSFISITKVLSFIFPLLKENAFLVALVKPQFEAGLDRLPRDGVIKDVRVREEILNEVENFAKGHGWIHHATILSPIKGKSGNVEYLCHFTRS